MTVQGKLEIPGQTGQTRTYQFTGLTGLTWNLNFGFPISPVQSCSIVIFSQPVAISIHRMDVPRIIGVRFDLPSKASDQVVHASSERDILISPNIPQQLFASHDLAGALAHIAQHFDFALAERHLFIVAFRSVPVEIDTER